MSHKSIQNECVSSSDEKGGTSWILSLGIGHRAWRGLLRRSFFFTDESKRSLGETTMADEIVQQIKERMRMDRSFRHDLLASPLRVLQGYALTEEEIQRFVAPNFSWMIEQ